MKSDIEIAVFVSCKCNKSISTLMWFATKNVLLQLSKH